MALTATADFQTRAEIVERLQLRTAREFVSSFDRPNIRYQIVEKENGRRQLLDFIRRNTRVMPVLCIACRAKKSKRPPNF